MAKANNLQKFSAFRNEEEAISLLESLRWPNGVACPRCGGADPYRITARNPTPGKRAVRKGLWKCSQCRKQFTVKVGTVFESSHIPVSQWLQAIHLLCASKKGMSAHQLHRIMGIHYRSAWFMFHRLRHAMSENTVGFPLSGVVEADETYIGGKRRAGMRTNGRTLLTGRPGPTDAIKTPVVALVERKGRAMAFPVERVDGKTLQDAIRQHTRPKSTHMMTDDLKSYHGLDMGFAGHDVIKHSDGQYTRDDVHTNSVEGFFALLKRGIIGTFHHVSKGHLHRYCNEFAFRFSHREALGVNDAERAKLLVLSAEGKRLTYQSGTRASAA